MKLKPVTKLETTRETEHAKKLENEVMSANCDAIFIFLIYGQFGVIRKADSGHIVCKTYIFIKSKLLSYEN